jgi:hypothetical protein
MSYQQGSVTANVLVGFEQEAMSDLFDQYGDNFGDITHFVEGNPNLFLFGYGSPNNILQMEHSYGAQGKSGGGASVFNIKFIDPEVEFENKFLKHSNMQEIILHKFGTKRDPSKLTQLDIRKSSYGVWWKDKYDENIKAAKEAEGAKLKTQWVAWAPSHGGETAYTGRLFYKKGDIPGSPTGTELENGMYQLLDNYDAWKAGLEADPPVDVKCRWSSPLKLTLSTEQPLEAPSTKYHKENTVDQEVIKEIQAETTAEIQQAILTQNEMMNGAGTAKVYIAYGMGYDFKSWAGPFSTTLMGASNEYDAKGVRSLAITLVANTGQLGEGAREGVLGAGFGTKQTCIQELKVSDFNAFGQGNIVHKSSEEVKRVANLYREDYGDGYTAKWEEEHSGIELSYGKDHAGARPFEFLAHHIPGDIHTIIKSLITKYICGAISQNDIPMGNVVVLMPDLTKGLASLQEMMLTDVLTANGTRIAKEGKQWKDLGEGLYNNPKINTDKEKNAVSGTDGIISQMQGDVTMTTVFGFQVLKRLLECLGFEFTVMANREGQQDADSTTVDTEEETLKMMEGLAWSAYKEFDPYSDYWTGKNTKWSDSLLHFFGEKTTSVYRRLDPDSAFLTEVAIKKRAKLFHAVITNRYDENQEETIYRVLKDISSNSSIGMRPAMEWETDITILKALADHGVIATATQPALIFGDKQLIDKFVYGAIEFERTFSAEGSVNSFLQWIHPSDSERFSSMSLARFEALGGNQQAQEPPKKGVFPYCQFIFSKLYGISEGAYDRLFLPADRSEEATEEFKKMAAAGIPIFRSGHKNSNILSMKANLNPYWFAGLFVDNRSEKGKASGAGTGKVLKRDTKSTAVVDAVEKSGMTAEEMERYLEYTTKGNLEALGGVLETLQANVEEEFGFQITTMEDYRDTINFMCGITSGKNVSLPGADTSKGSKNIVAAENPKNTFLLVKGMLDSITTAAIDCSIKTVPYFKLSGLHCLSRPVIMLMREAQAANTPYYDKYSRGKENAFSTKMYSGFWNVMGFKHFISNKETYSEFTLIKQVDSTPPDYGNINALKTDLSEKEKEEALEASIISGQVYTADQVLMAESMGGDISTNLLENIQAINQKLATQGEMGSEN